MILGLLLRGLVYLLPFILLAYFVFWLIKTIYKGFNNSENDDEIEINMNSSDKESANIKDAFGDVSEVMDAEFTEED